MSDPSPHTVPGAAESPGRKLVGTTIAGRYKVESLLGAGGMGAVYLVQHALMHKRYALKVLNQQTAQQPEMVARFEREALAAAHVEHPNITAAIDFGKTDEGAFFLVLEYLEGQRLRDALASGPLDVRRSMHIVRQIASALEASHQQGIIHRDLKPENIMLVLRQGDRDFVKVLDFGLAKVEKVEPGSDAPAQVLTKHGMVCGTPKFMAPEQCVGAAVDGRADLYALGLILFEMLTGVYPFASDDISRIIRHQLTTPTPPLASVAKGIQVPASLEAIVMRLTQKQPEQRYESATALLAALAEVAEREGILPPEPSVGALTPPPRPAVAEPARDGSALLLSAADVVSETQASPKKAPPPDAPKPDTAATLHSIDILSEAQLPAAGQRPVPPAPSTKPPQASPGGSAGDGATMTLPKAPDAATMTLPKAQGAETMTLPKSQDGTRPAMAAATLAAFRAAEPQPTDRPVPSAPPAPLDLWTRLEALRTQLPAPLQRISTTALLAGTAALLGLLLLLALRTCD